MKNKRRIFILPEFWGKTIGACGWIRLLLPLSHPKLEEKYEINCDLEFKDIKKNDIVIIERLWNPLNASISFCKKIIKKIKKQKAYLIYTIDDNLLDLFREKEISYYKLSHHSILYLFLKNADLVIVSTNNLKKRLKHFNKNIKVIPNVLDEKLFLSKNPQKKKNKIGIIRFGYIGSPDHYYDLLSVLEPLRTILKKHKNKLQFEIIGLQKKEELKELFKNLPVKIIDEPIGEYKDFISWTTQNCNWDFAIAPLVENKFTECKSDIKFLDYGILKIPGIFSDVSAYNNVVKDKQNGLLSKNTIENWEENLDLMIENKNLRNKMAKAAESYVLSSRTINHQVGLWQRLLSGINK